MNYVAIEPFFSLATSVFYEFYDSSRSDSALQTKLMDIAEVFYAFYIFENITSLFSYISLVKISPLKKCMLIHKTEYSSAFL